jgi:group I intron endonuclease
MDVDQPIYGRIYLIVNTVNSKVYVGLTTQPLIKRWKQHLKVARGGGASLIARAIRKYGESKFSILELEKCSSNVELNAAEQRVIAKYNSTAPNGYNLTHGGGQPKLTERAMRNMSLAHGGLSLKQESGVVHKYQFGSNSYELASEYKVTASTIIRALKRRGVRIRTNRSLSDGQELEVIQRYLIGKSTVELGREYEVNHRTIWGILIRHGVQLRTISQAKGGLPVELELDVIYRYQSGDSATRLAGRYRVDRGTILNTLRRYGVQVRHRGLPVELEPEVIKKYSSGTTILQLSKEYDVSEQALSKMITRNGLQVKSFKFSKILSDEQELEAIQKYLAGLSSPKVGAEYGVNYLTIINLLNKHGVPVRTVKQAKNLNRVIDA